MKAYSCLFLWFLLCIDFMLVHNVFGLLSYENFIALISPNIVAIHRYDATLVYGFATGGHELSKTTGNAGARVGCGDCFYLYSPSLLYCSLFAY